MQLALATSRDNFRGLLGVCTHQGPIYRDLGLGLVIGGFIVVFRALAW